MQQIDVFLLQLENDALVQIHLTVDHKGECALLRVVHHRAEVVEFKVEYVELKLVLFGHEDKADQVVHIFNFDCILGLCQFEYKLDQTFLHSNVDQLIDQPMAEG